MGSSAFVASLHGPIEDPPRTEEIVIKIITTAKNFNKFSREFPYQTRVLGSPQNLKQGFKQVIGVPVTQKSFRENRKNLEIQML